MPRPLITDKKQKIEALAADPRAMKKTGIPERNRVLNRKRSAQYIATVTTLDAGGHTATESAREAIIAASRAELPELSIEEFPVGIVSRCYLGDPYEVHTLDLSGGIIHHYEIEEPLPADLERARSLALHPQYTFIEVYRDGEMRAVEKDGTVVLIEGNRNVRR
mgnify:CR=1 FL=1